MVYKTNEQLFSFQALKTASQIKYKNVILLTKINKQLLLRAEVDMESSEMLHGLKMTKI